MISVVIRNKNQSKALEFLLRVLSEKFIEDINEIIVIDNLSSDDSDKIARKYNARFESLGHFSYGGSANFAARKAKNNIVVIFSAHSYPVSHDFFKLIIKKFKKNPNLAGLRCLHSSNDFTNFINNISAKEDPNKSGLIFSGSVFNKRVWEKYPFNENIATFEDKEWTKRVLEKGYDIEFVQSIFHYSISRNRRQLFFRFKNDTIGNYQVWQKDISRTASIIGFICSVYRLVINLFCDLYYILKRFFFLLKFTFNRPKSEEYFSQFD